MATRRKPAESEVEDEATTGDEDLDERIIAVTRKVVNEAIAPLLNEKKSVEIKADPAPASEPRSDRDIEALTEQKVRSAMAGLREEEHQKQHGAEHDRLRVVTERKPGAMVSGWRAAIWGNE
jgi:hypothetical protein